MKITNPTLIRKFIYAGKSTFTLRSTKTGTRFTYKVTEADDDGREAAGPWFVGVLSGPDNQDDYRYAGVVFSSQPSTVRKGKKGIDRSSPSMVALNWFLTHTDSDQVEFFHSGSCAACGRELTVPASVVTGFGPVCAKNNGIAYGDHEEAIEAYKAEQSAPVEDDLDTQLTLDDMYGCDPFERGSDEHPEVQAQLPDVYDIDPINNMLEE